MKSFAKTFRTFLAMSLVLCMVMSCVTVSADEVPTVALAVTQLDEVPDTDGYYSVTATVSEATNGGSATILAYTGEAPTNATIGYANQDVLVDNTKTFNMELKKGTYTVLAGATGFAKADLETLVINGVAPTFNGATLNVATGLTDETAVKDAIVVENFPEATDGDKEEVTYSIGGTDADKFAISGRDIVIAAESLVANEAGYNFTLVATAGGETAGLAGNLKVASTTTYVKPATITATGNASYGANEEAAKALLPTTVALLGADGVDSGKTVEVTYTLKEYANDVYTFDVAFGTLPEKYDWISGTNENVTATVNVVDDRTVVKLAYTASYAVNYGEAKPEFGAITFVKADDNTAIEIPAENVTLGGWEGDEFNSEVNNGATYTYTNAVTLSGPYKFEDDNLTATASVTVTVTDDRQEISVPKFDNITIYYGDAEPVEALEELAANNVTLGEWVRENAEEEFDSCVDGGTIYTYTNKATANEGFKFAEGALEAPVEVKVVVKDERTEITAVKLSETDILVAWNGAEPKDALKAITAKAIAGEVETELVLELSEFKLADGEEFNNQEENHVNTYYAVASIPAASVNGFKFASAEVANVEVTVTIEEKVTITATPVGVTTFTVPYGTDIEEEDIITTTYTATVEGTDPVDVPVEWNYENFKADVPNTYTITGTLTAPAGYKFANEADATVEVTVTVEKKVITKADVVVNPAIINVEYGVTPVFDIVTAKAFGSVDLTINATWTCADDDTTTPGEHIYTNTVALTEEQKATYQFAGGADAVSITVVVAEPSYVVKTIEYLDAGKNVIDISEAIVVAGNADWDTALESYLPYYVKLTAETGETAEISTTGELWFERVNGSDVDVNTDEFPPAVGTLKYYGYKPSSTELPTYWSIAEGTIFPVVTVKTEGTPDAFVVRADGYNKNYVASRIGADSVITVEAADGAAIAGATGYAFSVNGGEKTWSTTPSYTIEKNDADVNGTRYTVEAFVQYEDGSELSKTINVTKYTSVFSGSVYINDTYGELDYSAVRSNRNRPITVSYKFVNVNDADYAFDGTAVVNVYHVDDLEAAIATYTFDKNATSYEISVDEIAQFAAKDGEYKFYVTYTDEAGAESAVGSFTSRKGTYISNNGTWYSDFTINDMTRSGITIRRNETLKNEFTLTDLGADGKAYIGYSLIGYNVDFEDIEAGEYAETTKTENTHEYNLAEDFANAANASYKFYSLAKLDSADQDYFDMKVSRVVYVYGNKTNISNLRFGVDGKQGATAGPKAEDGYITIAPYWYQEFSKDTYDYDEIRYELEFTAGTSYDRLKTAVKDGEVVENTTIVKFADTGVGADSKVGTVAIDVSAFDSKVEAVLRVYVDNDLDRTVNKTFWPQAQ